MAALMVGQGQGPDNSEGTLGVAPGATVISVAKPVFGDLEGVDPMLKECADAGADVINLSLISNFTHEAIAYAQARDVVLVAGSGNGGGDGPGGGLWGTWGVVGASGVNESLERDAQANVGGPEILFPDEPGFDFDTSGLAVMGPSSWQGWTEDTCQGMFVPSLNDPQVYEETCGTSNSTAITSGVVALIRAEHPELNAANVINRLLRTTTPPTDGSDVPSDVYGWGTINAERAVTADVDPVEHNPLGSVFTRSMGVWNDKPEPERPEPPAGIELDPAPVDEPIVIPEEYTTDSDSDSDSDSEDGAATGGTGEEGDNTAGGEPAAAADGGSSTPVGLVAGGGAVVLLAAGGLVFWLATRGKRAAGTSGTMSTGGT